MTFTIAVPEWSLETWLLIILMAYLALTWLVIGPRYSRAWQRYYDKRYYDGCEAWRYPEPFFIWLFAPITVPALLLGSLGVYRLFTRFIYGK